MLLSNKKAKEFESFMLVSKFFVPLSFSPYVLRVRFCPAKL